jgi:hypothetical protein
MRKESVEKDLVGFFSVKEILNSIREKAEALKFGNEAYSVP